MRFIVTSGGKRDREKNPPAEVSTARGSKIVVTAQNCKGLKDCECVGVRRPPSNDFVGCESAAL
jgi:hypothetical protein